MSYQDKHTLELVKAIKASSIANQWIIATAESCTGGMLSSALVDIEGASEFFDRGFVTYSNAAKKQILGVDNVTLEQFGAVSEPTAQQMAIGCLKNSQANLAVSITGVAGPGGGTKEKPVGMVCFGVAVTSTNAVDYQIKSYTKKFNGDRTYIRRQAVTHALKLIQKIIVFSINN